MKKFQNEVYSLVDESFLSKFDNIHIDFMKHNYYSIYAQFCNHYHRVSLSEDDFFTNMHRRRIQLYQLCCPYCGTIDILIRDKRLQRTDGYNYCPHCGRGSAVENIRNQINRYIRIANINRIGLKTLKEQHPNKEDWLIGYDCLQMEVIELASIIEVVFRDYFEALLYITNMGVKNDYLSSIVAKSTRNDFMNIEKANSIFKKAFNIDIKDKMDLNVWSDLTDIVNLRNMMVHNNGMVDNRFKRTQSFTRLKEKVEGPLYRLEDADVRKYLESVVYAVTDITNLFLKYFYAKRNSVIANHYFNKGTINLYMNKNE